MQIGTMKPRKLEECGEPSFKWSQDFVNSTCAAGERETPRFEVVSLFFSRVMIFYTRTRRKNHECGSQRCFNVVTSVSKCVSFSLL